MFFSCSRTTRLSTAVGSWRRSVNQPHMDSRNRQVRAGPTAATISTKGTTTHTIARNKNKAMTSSLSRFGPCYWLHSWIGGTWRNLERVLQGYSSGVFPRFKEGSRLSDSRDLAERV